MTCLRVKTLVEQGNAQDAEILLWNLSSATTGSENRDGGKKTKKDSDVMLRLRTCVPVLQLYCEKGDASSALRLYQKMRKAPSVHFEGETYSLILSTLARLGYFRNDSEDIEGSGVMGYAAGSGAELFDAIATEMADGVLEINSACARDIRNGLAAGFHGMEPARNLAQVPYDCSLAPVEDISRTSWSLVGYPLIPIRLLVHGRMLV